MSKEELKHLTPDEAISREIVYLSWVSYEIFDRLDYYQMIEVEDATLEKIRKIAKEKIKPHRWVTNRFLVDRMKKRFKGETGFPGEFPEDVVPLLSSEQWQRTRELEVQVYTRSKHRETMGLLHPDVVEFFEITPDQVTQLIRIGREFDERAKSIYRKMDEESAVASQLLYRAAGEILTNEQKAQYTLMTGLAFPE
ncbi:MAG: hypothetical protein R3C03_08765 [Pirellulaceae bacterium]